MSGLRFDVTPLLRGHWKGLVDGRFEQYHPDYLARAIMFLPVAMGLVSFFADWKITAPAPLLSAVALLAGALVGSFSNLSTWRLKLSEWSDGDDDRFVVQKAMLDETAAHLLTAALVCALTALALVIGTNTVDKQGHVTGLLAAVIIALGTYVLLLFILCLPRLYAAYVELNRVPDRLSGFARGRF